MAKVNRVHARIFITATLLIGSLSIALVGFNISKAHINKTIVHTKESTQPPSTAPVGPMAHIYSLPTRLLIPKLEINASVLPMGLTATGAMDSPKTNKDTGWYSLGARPGNVGSAVIDGHLGLRYKAVFKKLNLLVAGDTLSVIDNQGTTASFVVRDIRVFEKNIDTSEIFNSKDGAHLNLITCNGDWNSSQSTYDKRLVVFSDKI